MDILAPPNRGSGHRGLGAVAGICSVPSTMAWARSDRRRLLVAGAAAQQGEGLVDVQLEAFGQDALGLFDQDAAVQRGLQLLGQDVAAADGALLQQPDGGHVGQGLADAELALDPAARARCRRGSARR